eukprot:TRINITY_DN569_c0_g1_i7.p6 TRINITY_DN569_c0_g1~~TRINITY_DN569_c0_g1_i7.p6  ORF type:complete len:131 (+),score=12.62 TRINITY_DN569_c0_g1_i7:174-566(+)
MVKTLLVVIGVFFFLFLAHNADAQQSVAFANASVSANTAATGFAVPKGQTATLVDGSERFEIEAQEAWIPNNKKCQCPPPTFYSCNHKPCRRMMCSLYCPYWPYWNTCLYCSECEARSAGFTPWRHCWYV